MVTCALIWANISVLVFGCERNAVGRFLEQLSQDILAGHTSSRPSQDGEGPSSRTYQFMDADWLHVPLSGNLALLTRHESSIQDERRTIYRTH